MTDTTTGSTTATLVDTYLDMWRVADGDARTTLIAQVFTNDGRHVDPLTDVTGHEALAAMLGNVHATYPGLRIERTSSIDQHGDQLRFTWQLDAADGTRIVNGLDVVELAGDGRFGRVASFWGDLPER